MNQVNRPASAKELLFGTLVAAIPFSILIFHYETFGEPSEILGFMGDLAIGILALLLELPLLTIPAFLLVFYSVGIFIGLLCGHQAEPYRDGENIISAVANLRNTKKQE